MHSKEVEQSATVAGKRANRPKTGCRVQEDPSLERTTDTQETIGSVLDLTRDHLGGPEVDREPHARAKERMYRRCLATVHTALECKPTKPLVVFNVIVLLTEKLPQDTVWDESESE